MMRRNLIARRSAQRAALPRHPGLRRRRSSPAFKTRSSPSYDMLLLGPARPQPRRACSASLSICWTTPCSVVAGSETNDDPFGASSRKSSRDKIEADGRRWHADRVDRTRRGYHEKLSRRRTSPSPTPLGEIDMIKHAEGRLHVERAPDALLADSAPIAGSSASTNCPTSRPRSRLVSSTCSKSRDVQIRGFPVRLNSSTSAWSSRRIPRTIQTEAGSGITLLKDRIGSVVRTHYPLTRELGIAINDQNAWLDRDASGKLAIPTYIKAIVEEMAWPRGHRRT